ncbi:MAG TPA: aldo/keto reductase [Candidatus Binatia bacterium]|nr:aldo/keto reductase [Candidatus Binatia bacterium]
MDYRLLGKTGLRLSVLGFGCGSVGGLMVRGEPGEQVRVVARAIAAGVNYFDTAPLYGEGQSEQNLGRVLNELQATVYVGTKVRLSSAADLGNLPGAIMRSVDTSLQRLRRERVDLIQLHNPIARQRESSTETLGLQDVLGDVVAAFQRLREQGKTQFFGITGLGETAALHQVIDSGAFQSVQTCYNLLNPSAAYAVPARFPALNFARLMERAAGQGMGCIGIRVLAAGALSGVEDRHPIAVPTVAPIGSGPDYRADVLHTSTLRFLVEEGYVENLVEAALRFAWSTPHLSTALVGFSSLEQLEQAVTYAGRGGLPVEALYRLMQVWEQFGNT